MRASRILQTRPDRAILALAELCEERKDETRATAPPDDGRAEEVVLRLIVAPAAHAKAKSEEGPVGWLRSEDVVLVRVRDESVVRCHHRDVEMPEVAEER